MFSKPPAKVASDPNPRQESYSPMPADNLPVARKGPMAASLLGENMTLEGAISAEGELHVDGVIRGEVRVTKLTLGESGQIEGSVTAESVEIRGKVVGSLTAKQVKLCNTGYVDGDITHEQLAIEAGAFFQGRSLKFQRQPSAQITPIQPAAAAAD